MNNIVDVRKASLVALTGAVVGQVYKVIKPTFDQSASESVALAPIRK
jgi:hypothetical protein